MSGNHDTKFLQDEIARLERQLHVARSQLRADTDAVASESNEVRRNRGLALHNNCSDSDARVSLTEGPRSHHATHLLLLLSDSALPLGSFAYSSGLESYVAHHKPLPAFVSPTASFHHFLELSISSVACAVLPYLLAAYREPHDLASLDNDLDASTPCKVARRASVAQGRALLSVWERALRPDSTDLSGPRARAAAAVNACASGLRVVDKRMQGHALNGHIAPLWGALCRALGLEQDQAAYVFLLNHAKAVLSAAVRASVMGPYQAQTVLASQKLQNEIGQALTQGWDVHTENAGQAVPAMDLWIGRHELLYSRIFNS